MSTATYTPRLQTKYQKEVVPALMKKFGYSTVMQVPKLTKICLNRGVNGAVSDKKIDRHRIGRIDNDLWTKSGLNKIQERYLQL